MGATVGTVPSATVVMMPATVPLSLALFDLDNTLVNREKAFFVWAEGFAARYDLPLGAVDHLIREDMDGSCSREQFFGAVIAAFGLADGVDQLMADYDVDYPTCFGPEPDSVKAVSSLRYQGFKVAVVTNGFKRQEDKVKAAGLDRLVDAICISDLVGYWKPDRGIFQEAARRCGASLSGWMVGDAPLADIQGGRGVGLRTIWLHRGRRWDSALPPPDFVAANVMEAVDIISSSYP